MSLLACALTACVGSGAKSPSGDPQRQSRAEYDVARDLWLRQNRPRQALEHALLAVELDDENSDAAHLVALIYLDFCNRAAGGQGADDCRLDRAEQHARAALEAREDFREAKNTLAVILIHRSKHRAAIALLHELTEDILYQTPENAWGNLCWAYLETKRSKPALDACQRSVAAQPKFCVGWYRLGVARERLGRWKPALEAYDNALEADPRCAGLQDAYLGRARARLRLGKADAAVDDLRSCVKLTKRTSTGKECRSMLGKLE